MLFLIFNGQYISFIILFFVAFQQMANGVNTEWFDLQVKHGNYLPKEKERTLYQVQKEAQDKFAQENKLQNKLDQKDIQQIKEMQDDIDFDDQFMREYMAKRKNELSEQVKKHKYGQVIQINRTQYVREVTNAPAEDFVVIHLYQDSNQYCTLINREMQKLAAQQPHVKFVKIISTKCIQNFPDERCPCVIIYKGGKPVSNCPNVDLMIGRKIQLFGGFLMTQGVKFE